MKQESLKMKERCKERFAPVTEAVKALEMVTGRPVFIGIDGMCATGKTTLGYYLKEQFDYIILDCPAGIEQGFQNAIAGAHRAIVVTTPEVSAIRDADRIIGLLEARGFKQTGIVDANLWKDMINI